MKKLKYIVLPIILLSIFVFNNVYGIDLKYQGSYINPKDGFVNYCTTNEQEMFAECYTLLMTGNCYSKDTILKNFRKTTVEYNFAIPVLKEIKEMGIRTALITNGDPILQHFKITSLKLDDQFEEIIVSGETPFAKPDPKIFRLMAEKLNIDTGEMMYIGDHPLNDIEGSRNAGCIPVWVKTTGVWAFPEIEKPEFQVETVRDVPRLIRTVNER